MKIKLGKIFHYPFESLGYDISPNDYERAGLRKSPSGNLCVDSADQWKTYMIERKKNGTPEQAKQLNAFLDHHA